VEGNESVRPYKDVGLSLFKFTIVNVADRLKEYRKRKIHKDGHPLLYQRNNRL
jgi:hypothetical protein